MLPCCINEEIWECQKKPCGKDKWSKLSELWIKHYQFSDNRYIWVKNKKLSIFKIIEKIGHIILTGASKKVGVCTYYFIQRIKNYQIWDKENWIGWELCWNKFIYRIDK